MSIKQFAHSGIGELDTSHLLMWNLLHRIEKNIKNRDWDNVMLNLERLILATREHFEVEESLFKVHNVPGQEEHAQEHFDCVEALFMFRKRCNRYILRDEDALETEFVTVANSIVNHINLKDYDAAASIKRPA